MFAKKTPLWPPTATPVTDDWHSHLVGVEYYPLDSTNRVGLDVIFEHQHDAGHHVHKHTWSTMYEKKYMARPVHVVQESA